MWGAIAGAAASVAGSLLSSNSASSASSQSEYAAKHRYRWAVDDMRRAGLNPVLAATSGGIAGATAPNYQQGNFSGLGQAGQSAAAVYNSSTQRKQTDSNIQLQDTQSAKNVAEVPVLNQQALNYQTQNSNLVAQNELLKQQAITEAQRRVLMQAQTGLFSAQQGFTRQQTVNYALDAVEKQVRADYLRTDIGAESARVGIDNKAGGVVGTINAASSYLDRLRNPSASSAKEVRKIEPKQKPSQYQMELRRHYSH